MIGKPVIRMVMVVLLIALVVSCQKSEPITIGFVAGMSGKLADLGGAGRNGAILAVEQRNAAGGIKGRMVELVIKDDKQNPDTIKQIMTDLTGRNIELIIGPMTSSMAMAAMPVVRATKSILLSPTVTTTDLVGKDDNFLRVIATTTSYSSKSAHYQYEKLGVRSVAVIYDENNKSYTESWLNGFRKAFEGLGGSVVIVKTFNSAKEPVFNKLARELVNSKSDAVLIISNAVDAAMLCQQIRASAPRKKIVTAEWASTERFIELAGETAEGVVIAQFIDRNDKSSRYLEFLQAYKKRFQQEPGFAGLAGYDATQVALEAYAIRKKGGSLKEAIIAKKQFQGAQQLFNIDQFGDAERKSFVTTISKGKFVTVE